MSRASVSARTSAGSLDPTAAAGYLGRSARPLTSLVFLLPFMIIYELGTRLLLTDAVHGTQHIVAFTMMQDFFALFGAYGRHLPALAVVAILLSWHIARRDGWGVGPGTLFGMLLESTALGVPLIVFGLGMARFFPLANGGIGEGVSETVVLSLGAGIYEELVFRLILCTALAMVLRNGLKLDVGVSFLLLVLISSSLFSAYHYLGTETFNWRNFVFRTGAGIYFAILFVVRGFGVTAGSHMAYDILIIML
jgi:hypothetical protein